MQSTPSQQPNTQPEDRAGEADAPSPLALTSPRLRGTRWLPAVMLLLVIGLAASAGAALLWQSSVRDRERQSFQTLASDVSGRVELLVRRDTDLVRAAVAVFAMQPEISASGFRRWARLLEEAGGTTGAFGVLLVRSLAPAQLQAFLARRNSDPVFSKLVGGQIEAPEAGASRYCLLAAGSVPLSDAPILAQTLQGNWCNPSSPLGSYSQNGITRAQLTRMITEADTYGIYKVPASPVSTMAIEAPVFPAGAVPASAGARWREVIGWVAGSFDIESLLRAALGAHNGLRISLYHSAGGFPAEEIGQAGQAAGGFTRSELLPLDGNWKIEVAGAASIGGLGANAQAVIVGLAGTIATLLVVALIGVLARSRRHALALVRRKTAQLEHLALHDALTDLPNRVLALDRAEQMLARARREHKPMAALYVDVDGFKDVNDNFGHAAGDRLLSAIAERLAGAVREGETAARFGGDEFVVLVEPEAMNGGPEHLAERLIEVLRDPYELDQAHDPVRITASVGVAKGTPTSVDELLREADVALYRAKESGRNRYAVFGQHQLSGSAS